MTRRVVSSGPTVGPYSPGVYLEDHLFLSGQTPISPATGRIMPGGIDDHVRQCLDNLKTVLEAAGLGFDDVIKCNVYLVRMADYDAMNRIYVEQFHAPYPARTTIGVASLPLGAAVEIEMIAARSSSGRLRA